MSKTEKFVATMEYKVGTFRGAGLEARWTKTRMGVPFIAVRNPNAIDKHQREQWWMVTISMWKSMHENGVVEGFDRSTVWGDLFSIPV